MDEKLRQRILERDQRKCQFCGEGEGQIEVHHIRPRREFEVENDSNKPSNLVSLCKSCHQKLEPNSPELQRKILRRHGVGGSVSPLNQETDREYLNTDEAVWDGQSNRNSNPKPRALLTDGERQAIQDAPDLDPNTKSSHLSRISGKKEQLRNDASLLLNNRPDLYEAMRDAFVEEEFDERVARLENEVEELREQLED